MTPARLTRRQALDLLNRSPQITFEQIGDIFAAFDFEVDSPSFDTEVYYHADYNCGLFTARDPSGYGVLTDYQRDVARTMLECVEVHETHGPPRPK